MEVILIKDMENLGYANDIVNVKPGYANNYLIPQGYAKAATASAKKVLAENLRQRAHKDAKILADAQALAETIANLPLSLAVKAEEGKLFGTVTAADLAEALAAKGIDRGPQADHGGRHQDRRRVRGYGPSAQGGQGYDQILGYRSRIRFRNPQTKKGGRCFALPFFRRVRRHRNTSGTTAPDARGPVSVRRSSAARHPVPPPHGTSRHRSGAPVRRP